MCRSFFLAQELVKNAHCNIIRKQHITGIWSRNCDSVIQPTWPDIKTGKNTVIITYSLQYTWPSWPFLCRNVHALSTLSPSGASTICINIVDLIATPKGTNKTKWLKHAQ